MKKPKLNVGSEYTPAQIIKESKGRAIYVMCAKGRAVKIDKKDFDSSVFELWRVTDIDIAGPKSKAVHIEKV